MHAHTYFILILQQPYKESIIIPSFPVKQLSLPAQGTCSKLIKTVWFQEPNFPTIPELFLFSQYNAKKMFVQMTFI